MRLRWADVTERVADITTDITGALADVSGIGPFFAVSTDVGVRVDSSWRTLTEFCTDSALLRRRIDEVRRLLGAAENRVAASLAFQSLAARIVSPPLALAVVHGVVPMLAPTELDVRPMPGGPWPMWTAPPVLGRVVAPADEAAALHELLVEPLLVPLVAAVRAVVPVAAGLLWGNVASSLAGAAAVLARARPAAGARAVRLVSAMLRGAPLAGTGGYGLDGRFRRSSCCLYYRTPDGGLCGDCPFDSPPGR